MREVYQRYSGVGWTGIVLLITGVALMIFNYSDVVITGSKTIGSAYNVTPPGAKFSAALFLIGGFFSTVSVPMILIGRIYEIYDKSTNHR